MCEVECAVCVYVRWSVQCVCVGGGVCSVCVCEVECAGVCVCEWSVQCVCMQIDQ